MPRARIVFWVATMTAFAIVVRTFWLGPLPLVVSALALFGYLTLIISGYIFPRWGMFADVIDEALPGRHLVGLSFDDGPDPESTRYVLATLERYGARATFFVIGKKAEEHPEVISEILAAGHELGVHGYSHSRLTAFRSAAWMKRDFERARAVLEAQGVATAKWLRPPIGHVTPRLVQVVEQLGLVLLCWTIRGLDGLPGVARDKVAARVISQLHDGAIVALHDAFEKQSGLTAGAEALAAILEAMQQQELRGVTVTELLEGT